MKFLKTLFTKDAAVPQPELRDTQVKLVESLIDLDHKRNELNDIIRVALLQLENNHDRQTDT